MQFVKRSPFLVLNYTSTLLHGSLGVDTFSPVLSGLNLKCFKLFVKYRLIKHCTSVISMAFDV